MDEHREAYHLFAAVAALRRGSRVVYWDAEDRPASLATRLSALDAADLIGAPSLVYAVPDLADNPIGLGHAVLWLMGGKRPGVVTIDAAESHGCSSDSSDVTPWFQSHIDPWLKAGASVLLLDHVPKRRQDRPRGGIGSQHKLARVDGAALYVAGRPWNKATDGKVQLRVDKDRPGDLPARMGQWVAVINAQHRDGVLEYSIQSPEAENGDSTDVADPPAVRNC